MAAWQQPACTVPPSSTTDYPEPAPAPHWLGWLMAWQTDVSPLGRVHTKVCRTGEKAPVCTRSAAWSWSRSISYHPISKGRCYSQPSLCSEPAPSLPLSWCTGPPLCNLLPPKCKQLPGRFLGAGKTHLPRVTKHRQCLFSGVTGTSTSQSYKLNAIPIF